MLGNAIVTISARTMCLFWIPGSCLGSETNILAQLLSTVGLDPIPATTNDYLRCESTGLGLGLVDYPSVSAGRIATPHPEKGAFAQVRDQPE